MIEAPNLRSWLSFGPLGVAPSLLRSLGGRAGPALFLGGSRPPRHPRLGDCLPNRGLHPPNGSTRLKGSVRSGLISSFVHQL